MHPLVSIIVPVFNRVEFLKECINSIIAQSYKNWELLLIDDGSTRENLEEIQSFIKNEEKIKLVERKSGSKGASSCRNLGVKRSTGNYLIFLDSDDMLSEDCLLQRVNQFIDDEDCDFLVFQTMKFFIKPYDDDHVWNIDNEEEDLVRFVRRDAVWQTAGPIWKKDFVVELGGFDSSFSNAQDVEFHIRALLKKPQYKKFLRDSPNIFNRSHDEGSISQSGYSSNKDTCSSQIKLLKIMLNSYAIESDAYKKAVGTFTFHLIHVLTKARYFSLRKDVIKLSRELDVFGKVTKIRLNIYLFNDKFFTYLDGILLPPIKRKIYKTQLPIKKN